jgi:hypothetical protein
LGVESIPYMRELLSIPLALFRFYVPLILNARFFEARASPSASTPYLFLFFAIFICFVVPYGGGVTDTFSMDALLPLNS